MADQINDMVAQALADQVNQQNVSEEETRAQHVEAQTQIADVRNSLLKKLIQGQSPKVEIPVSIQQIVQILMAQPRFVDPTMLFLQNLVSRVNTAVDEILKDALDNSS
jgi:hypothetical protein